MRGFLSFLILFLLSKKDMSGNDLALELEKRRGEKPSPGTIYPALKNLNKEGLIKERKEGKSVLYSLTEIGEEALKTAKLRFCRTFSDIF